MAAKYWIKLYHEILDDYKMARLPDRLWRRAIELFLLAGDTDQGGALPDVEEIAFRLRVDPEVLREDVAALVEIGILSVEEDALIVTRFEARQAASDSTERSRYFRARQARGGNSPAPEQSPAPEEEENESFSMGQRNNNRNETKRCPDTESETESEAERETESDADAAPKTRAAAAVQPCSTLYEAFLTAVHDPDPPPERTPYPEWEAIFAELAGDGVQPVDVREAVRWLRANGKHPRHPRAILGAARVAMRQRGTSPREPVPESRSRYLRGPYAELINH